MKRRKFYYLFLILLISLTIAEVLLRSIIPFEIAFQTWFSPGAQRPDERFGFVFSKNYQGFMRHRDGVLNVPIELDRYGFRQPFKSTKNKQTASKKAVLIGGASLMFSYGLPDRHTIPAQLVSHSCLPLKSYTASWPGVTLYRNFHIYRKKLEPHITPDLAIISIYKNDLYAFKSIPNKFDNISKSESITWLYRNDKPVIVYPNGFFAERLGKLYYQSYILSQLVSLIDSGIEKVESTIDSITNASSDEQTGPENKIRRNKNFKNFISYLQEYFNRKNIPMMIVFLPSMTPKETELFSELREAVPAQINAVDLHKQLRENFDIQKFIAGNHYSKTQASLIGKSIAQESCQLLKNGSQ